MFINRVFAFVCTVCLVLQVSAQTPAPLQAITTNMEGELESLRSENQNLLELIGKERREKAAVAFLVERLQEQIVDLNEDLLESETAKHKLSELIQELINRGRDLEREYDEKIVKAKQRIQMMDSERKTLDQEIVAYRYMLRTLRKILSVLSRDRKLLFERLKVASVDHQEQSRDAANIRCVLVPGCAQFHRGEPKQGWLWGGSFLLFGALTLAAHESVNVNSATLQQSPVYDLNRTRYMDDLSDSRRVREYFLYTTIGIYLGNLADALLRDPPVSPGDPIFGESVSANEGRLQVGFSQDEVVLGYQWKF